MSNFLDDYEPVDSRIAKFWAKHPEGSLQTELIEASSNRFIVKATAYTADGLIIATGYAEETISQKGVNANFALPNCETSALGRCLANAGFQAKLGKRASREEMEKVERVKEAPVDQDVWIAKDVEAETLAKAIGTIKAVIPDAKEIPQCSHGTMERKSGISKTTGNPYSGYTCPSKNKSDQCRPIWDK